MSTAREDILRRITEAGAGMPLLQVDRRYDTSLSLSQEELLNLFEERILDYKASFIRSTNVTLTISNIIAENGLRNILIPAGLSTQWATGTPDNNFSPDQLDQFDCVITSSELGIATTGTIVLNHSDSAQGRRAISLVPDTHICIVQEERVLGTVVEAVRKLNPREHQTWISGPSATSDIELERVEGVHGPRNLHVILAIR